MRKMLGLLGMLGVIVLEDRIGMCDKLLFECGFEILEKKVKDFLI